MSGSATDTAIQPPARSACGYRRCTEPLTLPGVPWCVVHHAMLQQRLRPRECLVCWQVLHDPFTLFCSDSCWERWPRIWCELGMPPPTTEPATRPRRRRRAIRAGEEA